MFSSGELCDLSTDTFHVCPGISHDSSVQWKHEGGIPEKVEKFLPQQTAAAPESAEPEVELAMRSPMASILLVISSSLFASWKQGLGIEVLVWICSSLPTETPSQAPPLYCSMGPLLPRCFLYYGRSLMGSLLLFYPVQELPAYDRSP